MIKPNAVDRVVNWLSPVRGNRRLEARYKREVFIRTLERREERESRRNYNGGFESAEATRDGASWLKSRLSPDSALEESRQEQLERADSAYKNYELGTSHVEGRADRVTGTGTSLDPAIDPDDGDFSEEQAEDWNRVLRNEWARQTLRIGKGNKPLWKVQRLMTRHLERHGEWFLLIGDKRDPLAPTTLKVEVIHPKRIETPPGKEGDATVRMGVQLNGDGEAIGYYVRDNHPGDTLDNRQNHRYIPAYYANGLPRLIHHYEESEAGEHRGYPQMQVGLKRLKNTDEYEDAEIERNYIGACLSAFVRTDLGIEDATAGDAVDGDGKKVRSFAPGMIQYIGESDNVDIASPQGAPASYEAFMQRQAMTFAAGAGTSYPFLTRDFRGLNYNTLKVVWNTEEGTCDIHHKAQADALVWVYWHFVNRCILVADVIQVDVAAYRSRPWLYSAVRVIPPQRRSIDPAREDNAEIRLIENGIKPASDLVERKNGQPSPQVYRRIKRDTKQREDEGVPVIEKPNTGQTMPGDLNQESSDANKERQEVGA